jgi:hypothetical protein
MCSFSILAISCPEHARLEDEYLQARDRMRNFLTGSREAADSRLRKVTRVSRFAAGKDEEERRLAVQMAMAIARLKEHIAAHGCER